MKDQFDKSRILYAENVCRQVTAGEAVANTPLGRARDFDSLYLVKDDDNSYDRVAIIGGGPTLSDPMGDGYTRLESLDQRNNVVKVLCGSAHKLVDQGKLENGADIAVFNTPGAAWANVVGDDDHCLEYWVGDRV